MSRILFIRLSLVASLSARSSSSANLISRAKYDVRLPIGLHTRNSRCVIYLISQKDFGETCATSKDLLEYRLPTRPTTDVVATTALMSRFTACVPTTNLDLRL